MSHITYHYLYNGDQLKGNYLYDVTHLPNKQLREKIYKDHYIGDIEFRLKTQGATDMLKLFEDAKTLEDKAHLLFKISWDNGAGKVLGKPYPGL